MAQEDSRFTSFSIIDPTKWVGMPEELGNGLCVLFNTGAEARTFRCEQDDPVPMNEAGLSDRIAGLSQANRDTVLEERALIALREAKAGAPKP